MAAKSDLNELGAEDRQHAQRKVCELLVLDHFWKALMQCKSKEKLMGRFRSESSKTQHVLWKWFSIYRKRMESDIIRLVLRQGILWEAIFQLLSFINIENHRANTQDPTIIGVGITSVHFFNDVVHIIFKESQLSAPSLSKSHPFERRSQIWCSLHSALIRRGSTQSLHRGIERNLEKNNERERRRKRKKFFQGGEGSCSWSYVLRQVLLPTK